MVFSNGDRAETRVVLVLSPALDMVVSMSVRSGSVEEIAAQIEFLRGDRRRELDAVGSEYFFALIFAKPAEGGGEIGGQMCLEPKAET